MFKLLPVLNSEREKLINIENIPLIAEFIMPSTSDHMRNKNVDIYIRAHDALPQEAFIWWYAHSFKIAMS